MLTVAAQTPRPTAPQPQLLTRRPLAHTPAWRLHAASVFGPEPSGPFSFWPRVADAVKGKPQLAARGKKAEKPAAAPAESSLDTFEPDAPVGAPRFRSALEQVRRVQGSQQGGSGQLVAGGAAGGCPGAAACSCASAQGPSRRPCQANRCPPPDVALPPLHPPPATGVHVHR